ncbi:hypothetical protein GDO86_005756 [Hymenochirus boettgeri]|uniref:SCP domain-containing protein n=1 Tax=Hymenochirus boettgeri TaxID=247094 RepID=A0A8T2J8Q3_9PIPI|nr:hypothetical protein GDO86_005756 [Hymenochirus boettgeri]
MWRLQLVFALSVARRLDPTPPITNQYFVDSLLLAHNEIRNEYGERAADMIHMSWDIGLARLAQAWTIYCKNELNPNLKRGNIYPRFNYIGENLYMGPSIDIFKIVTSWGLESNYYNFQNNTCQPGKNCDHFTQIIWGSTFKVGCGAAYCAHMSAYVVSCTYGPRGNVPGQDPFIQGEKCSKCKGEMCKVASCSNPQRDNNYGDYNFCPDFAKIDCYRLGKGNIRVNNVTIRVGLECPDCIYTDGDSENLNEDHYDYVEGSRYFNMTPSSAVETSYNCFLIISLICNITILIFSFTMP